MRPKTNMRKSERDDIIELRGTVADILPCGFFRVDTPERAGLLCKLSGRMRMNKISIVRGDDVDVEVSSHDLDKGRITFRRTAGRTPVAA